MRWHAAADSNDDWADSEPCARCPAQWFVLTRDARLRAALGAEYAALAEHAAQARRPPMQRESK